MCKRICSLVLNCCCDKSNSPRDRIERRKEVKSQEQEGEGTQIDLDLSLR